MEYLKQIPIDDIIYKQRAREEFGDLSALEQSISQNGIIQPLTVTTDPKFPNKFILVAGERRLRSCLNLGLESVPCVVRESLPVLQQKTQELEENLNRKDFSWPERLRLLQEINDLNTETDPLWSPEKLSEKTHTSSSRNKQLLRFQSDLTTYPFLTQGLTALTLSMAMETFYNRLDAFQSINNGRIPRGMSEPRPTHTGLDPSKETLLRNILLDFHNLKTSRPSQFLTEVDHTIMKIKDLLK